MKISYYKVLLFSCLFIINVLLRESTLSFVLTGAQVVFVLQFLLRNRIQDAAYWHFIFMITSIAVAGVGDEDVVKTGYFSTKLIGPVTLSYVIAIIILFFSFTKKGEWEKGMLFEKMQNLFVFFLISGIILGGIGLLMSDYFVNAFIGYSVYIVIILIHVLILKNLYNSIFLRKCYDAVIPLLMASVITTIYNWIADITYNYSIFEKTLSTSMAEFSVLLFMFIPLSKFKEKIIIVVLMMIYLFVLLQTGASGKFFINVSIVGLAYILNQIKNNGIGVLPALALVLVICSFVSGNLLEESLFNRKLNQFISLGSISSGSIEDVGSSPYIRIASMLNIYLENLKNPIYFIVGRGYGGYFEDSLNLFQGLDLTAGAFSDEAVRLGKYSTAHSTFNMVPLFHGFVGLFLILKIVYQYFLRAINKNPLSLVAGIWLLFMFYFNIQLGVIGIFLLYCSEYDNGIQSNIVKLKH